MTHLNSDDRYILRDWSCTDLYLSKLRISSEFNESFANSDLIKYYEETRIAFLGFIIKDCENDIFLGVRLFQDQSVNGSNGKLPSHLIELFYKYLTAQLNTMFKKLINEFSNDQSFIRELCDEKTAFYIKVNEKGIHKMASLVEINNNSEEILQTFNTILFKSKTNKNLLAKISEGENNAYLKFLYDSIEYLKNKSLKDNKINRRTDNGSSNYADLKNNETCSKKDFRALFKSNYVYDKLIAFMIAENLISEGKNRIVWHGLKQNRKFEIVSFYEALFLRELLKNGERVTNKELQLIASNTFFDFKISSKTIGNKENIRYIKQYGEMLLRFTQSSM